MSPERFKGEVGPFSDIYSLGVTLYELLTFRAAFNASDPLSMLERIRNVVAGYTAFTRCCRPVGFADDCDESDGQRAESPVLQCGGDG